MRSRNGRTSVVGMQKNSFTPLPDGDRSAYVGYSIDRIVGGPRDKRAVFGETAIEIDAAEVNDPRQDRRVECRCPRPVR